MAIIALIVTPLVMNIIRSARTSADKRSIDAYGRSIELAIAGYLMDNGSFPTSIEQLTIEYSGDEVVCTTTQLNSDSSVYLAGCTVGGRSVENYTYGSDKTPSAPTYTAYTVGDEVTYNNVNYYVIKDSSVSEDSVTLLKAEPLSYEEANVFSEVSASNRNGYGGIQYGTNSTYTTSYVKQTIAAWKVVQAPLATEARLITLDDLTNNLGYEYASIDPSNQGYVKTEITPEWLYNNNYDYWTMIPYDDSTDTVYYVDNYGGLRNIIRVSDESCVVRPVIVLPKSVLQ